MQFFMDTFFSIGYNGWRLGEVAEHKTSIVSQFLNYKNMSDEKNNGNFAKPRFGTGFWFIEYDIDCELWDNKKRNQCVSDQHPFEWLKFLSKISSFKRTLVSWQEITEEEYKIGKDFLGIG